MRYRPEIDGLRTVALVPVILFHSGLALFSGGFVGVDVFFVISGYLITTLILNEMEAGKFSLVAFYERRIRRLLPALFFVVCCCLPFAWAWMRPTQLGEFARSLVAVTLFSSNFEFWRESGYFAATVDEKPLLHTWSLAVEEQYYLFFPILLAAVSRFGRRSVTTLLALGALGSFGLCQYFSYHHPEANYYFLPTRAWEFLIGGLSALVLLESRESRPRFSNLLSALGLLAILASVLLYDKKTPFPGVYALAPAVGAALIILHAVPGTLAHRLLCLRPMVGLGLISYSVYLWHQPLLAFARLGALGSLPPYIQLSAALLSIPLGYASWVWIENPFRSKFVWPKRSVFAVVASLAAAIVCGAFVLSNHIGFSAKNTILVATENRISNNYGLSPECDYPSDFTAKPACQTGRNPNILVWGDSFAMQLVDGVMAGNPGRPIIQATRSVCGPVLGLSPMDATHPLDWARQCLNFNRSVLNYIVQHPDIEDVVLSSIFTQYLDGNFEVVTKYGRQSANFETAKSAFLETLRSLKAMGKRVTIVSPPALDGGDLGECLYKTAARGRELADCDFPVDDYRAFNRETTNFVREIGRESAVRVVWLPDYTCSGSTCFASEAGVFLYRDDRHLSREGVIWLGANTPAFHLGAQRQERLSGDPAATNAQ